MACAWNEATKERFTVFKGEDPVYIVDQYIQKTDIKREDRVVGTETETRTTEQGRQCRTVTKKQTFKQVVAT